MFSTWPPPTPPPAGSGLPYSPARCRSLLGCLVVDCLTAGCDGERTFAVADLAGFYGAGRTAGDVLRQRRRGAGVILVPGAPVLGTAPLRHRLAAGVPPASCLACRQIAPSVSVRSRCAAAPPLPRYPQPQGRQPGAHAWYRHDAVWNRRLLPLPCSLGAVGVMDDGGWLGGHNEYRSPQAANEKAAPANLDGSDLS